MNTDNTLNTSNALIKMTRTESFYSMKNLRSVNKNKIDLFCFDDTIKILIVTKLN